MAPPALRRLPRWPERLDAYIERRRALPFEWGTNDCFAFCMGAVEAITGRNPYPSTWTDALSAMREIERHGTLEAVLASVLGRAGQNWREARRGDIVLAEQDEGPERAAAWRRPSMLCVGDRLVGPGVDRLEFRRLADAVLVWRVG